MGDFDDDTLTSDEIDELIGAQEVLATLDDEVVQALDELEEDANYTEG